MIIAIDGPAGVGKSSVSHALADALNFTYIDTGAMFRSIALAVQENDLDWQNEGAITALLPSLKLSFQPVGEETHIFLNGEDVESKIRTPEMIHGTSIIATFKAVRHFLLQQQRAMGKIRDSLLEGRDIGTAVFPNAEIKFFLEASSHERARRRLAQMREKGDTSEDLASLQKKIEARDLQDQNREVAPLCCADDAIRIDTSKLSLEGVIETLLTIVRKYQKNLDE